MVKQRRRAVAGQTPLSGISSSVLSMLAQTTKECYESSGVSSVTLFMRRTHKGPLSPSGEVERAVNHLGSFVF